MPPANVFEARDWRSFAFGSTSPDQMGHHRAAYVLARRERLIKAAYVTVIADTDHLFIWKESGHLYSYIHVSLLE